jgi:hypothetical protein
MNVNDDVMKSDGHAVSMRERAGTVARESARLWRCALIDCGGISAGV